MHRYDTGTRPNRDRQYRHPGEQQPAVASTDLLVRGDDLYEVGCRRGSVNENQTK